jgi:hypothetical protein
VADITHIISCGLAAPPMAYVTMHARVTKTETSLLIKALPELFKFINELRAKKGRVRVFSLSLSLFLYMYPPSSHIVSNHYCV